MSDDYNEKKKYGVYIYIYTCSIPLEGPLNFRVDAAD